jgi:hypothetical protein
MDRVSNGGNQPNTINSRGWFQSKLENIENTPEAVDGSRNRNPDTDTVSTKTVGHSRQNRPEQTRVPRFGPGS